MLAPLNQVRYQPVHEDVNNQGNLIFKIELKFHYANMLNFGFFEEGIPLNGGLRFAYPLQISLSYEYFTAFVHKTI